MVWASCTPATDVFVADLAAVATAAGLVLAGYGDERLWLFGVWGCGLLSGQLVRLSLYRFWLRQLNLDLANLIVELFLIS
jgi:hypothetical protein